MGIHISGSGGGGGIASKVAQTYLLLNDMLTAMGSTKTSFWPALENTGDIIRTYGETAHIFTMTDSGTLGFMPVQHPGHIQSYHFDKTDSMHGAGENSNDFFFDDSGTNVFSVGCWVNRDVESVLQIMLAVYDVAGTLRGWQFGIDASNKVFLELYDESADADETAEFTTALTLNTWQFVVATYNSVGGTSANAGITLYLDATVETEVLTDSGTYVAMENSATPLMLGAADDTAAATNEMDGRIALPFICGKELSAANVTTIYNAGRTLLGI